VLAAFLFGIIQWGLIISANITLHNAAALVARQLTIATAPSDAGQQVSVATLIAQQALTTSANMDINHLATPVISSVSLGSASLGSGISVSLSYSMPLFFPIVVPGAQNGSLTINANTLMR
jgi:hypothetical protein